MMKSRVQIRDDRTRLKLHRGHYLFRPLRGPGSVVGSLCVCVSYDTIRYASLTCAQKPTWVSLIYTAAQNQQLKSLKQKKTKKEKKRICSEVSVNSPGNPPSQSCLCSNDNFRTEWFWRRYWRDGSSGLTLFESSSYSSSRSSVKIQGQDEERVLFSAGKSFSATWQKRRHKLETHTHTHTHPTVWYTWTIKVATKVQHAYCFVDCRLFIALCLVSTMP